VRGRWGAQSIGNGIEVTKERDRFATAMIYLTDEEHDGIAGGADWFGGMNLTIKPKRGRAVVFNSMTGNKCGPIAC
jgi:hypothetical protein